MYCTDPEKGVHTLIAQSAPERRERLDMLWDEHAVRFKLVNGRSGIVLNADKDRVELACKDLQIMWLLGFSLWKSIELFSPTIMLSKLPDTSSSSILMHDDKVPELEYYYRQRIAAVLELIGANKLEPKRWPPDIPLPVASRDDLANVEDIAAFDLVMMGTAVLFLHELKHVDFHAKHAAGTPRPSRFAEEELLCDVWAREWFMLDLGEYARRNGYDYQSVCSKRAMALLLVCEYLRLAKEHAGAVINVDYPPLALRVEALSGAVELPCDDNYWVLSACILLAEVRRQGKENPEFEGTSPKEITERLIRVLNYAA